MQDEAKDELIGDFDIETGLLASIEGDLYLHLSRVQERLEGLSEAHKEGDVGQLWQRACEQLEEAIRTIEAADHELRQVGFTIDEAFMAEEDALEDETA